VLRALVQVGNEAALALALVLGVLLVALTGDERSRDDASATRGSAGANVLRVDKTGWETDFSKHSVPLSGFQSGGPPRDGIPPVDEPRQTSLANAERWLSDREPVRPCAAGRVTSGTAGASTTGRSLR
jgi:hypothetical protein